MLTNQRSFGTRDDSLRSRGGLVLDALAAVSPGRVHQDWFAEGRPSETSFKDVLHLTRGAG